MILSTPVNGDWLTQFNALFVLSLDVVWRCACGASRPPPAINLRDEIGFESIGILPDGTADSVSAAIHRSMQDQIWREPSTARLVARSASERRYSASTGRRICFASNSPTSCRLVLGTTTASRLIRSWIWGSTLLWWHSQRRSSIG
jgi:hypothetical protein